MTVCVVVVLEAIVIDHFDAEAVATVLFTKGAEQPLFAELPAIEERAAVTAHPAEERFALLELDALLPKLFDHVQEHPVPVLDLVADGDLERFEAGSDEIQLRRRELEHPADIIEQVMN